jgi:hypothetical protein
MVAGGAFATIWCFVVEALLDSESVSYLKCIIVCSIEYFDSP